MKSQWCWLNDDFLWTALIEKSSFKSMTTIIVADETKTKEFRHKFRRSYNSLDEKSKVKKSMTMNIKFINGSSINFLSETALLMDCDLIVFLNYENMELKKINSLLFSLSAKTDEMLFQLNSRDGR